MKFAITDRTLIKMLFERGTVDEIDGKLPDGRTWSVTVIRPNLWRDYTFFDGYIAGAYSEDFRGATLDETFAKMEAWLEEETATQIELCGRAI